MAKKGYAYKKAIELIAYEKKQKSEISLPKSKALRGAIYSWKRKIEAGYRPKSAESKTTYNKTFDKFDLAEKRPFMKIENQYHSKRIGNDLYDLIFGFSLSETLKISGSKGSPSLIDFDLEKVEVMQSIAQNLEYEKNPKIWNREFKKKGLEVKVWYENYYEIVD